MKTWVKVLLGIAGFIGVIILIVIVVFQMTSGMTDSADAFFTAVKQKDMATARSYLAEDFKKSTDEHALSAFLAESAILNFKESSWSNRKIENGRGELEGSISTDSGGVVPIKLSFVKENEEWKIYAIEKPSAGLTTSSKSEKAIKPTVPDKDTQIVMIKQAMHDFIVSIKAKDMTHFRSTLSHLWQEQYSVEKLNTAYKAIMDSPADWSVLEAVTPELSAEPSIEANGILTLIGSYPTKPSRVDFEQSYLYENNAWKLVSFSIEAKAADKP